MTTEHLTDAELQSLRNLGNEAEAAADEIERLRPELRRLSADAQRYAFLRRCRGQEHDPLFTVQHELDGTLWGGDLDAAIDQAIGKEVER